MLRQLIDSGVLGTLLPSITLLAALAGLSLVALAAGTLIRRVAAHGGAPRVAAPAAHVRRTRATLDVPLRRPDLPGRARPRAPGVGPVTA